MLDQSQFDQLYLQQRSLEIRATQEQRIATYLAMLAAALTIILAIKRLTQ
jgi:hypothetical protein